MTRPTPEVTTQYHPEVTTKYHPFYAKVWCKYSGIRTGVGLAFMVASPEPASPIVPPAANDHKAPTIEETTASPSRSSSSSIKHRSPS
eukprot:m.285479 g.285479  ORF g.285479 m.285479 type:complete len:88 (+) comp27034_c2_seq21:2253-2516(+)